MNVANECNERVHLWQRYRAAFRSYADAIGALEATEFGSGFQEAVADARRARLGFEALWDEYCQHVSDHGCRADPLSQSDDVPTFLFPRSAGRDWSNRRVA